MDLFIARLEDIGVIEVKLVNSALDNILTTTNEVSRDDSDAGMRFVKGVIAHFGKVYQHDYNQT